MTTAARPEVRKPQTGWAAVFNADSS
jgi:hypothetical protein